MSENRNFVQFNRSIMKQHRELIKKNALAAEIMTFFIEQMNHTNAIVCSAKVLMEITGYGRASVSKAIRLLKDDNWVNVVKIGTANAYVVNSAAFWTTTLNKQEFSTFHATVITSDTEQKTPMGELSRRKLRKIPTLEALERPILSNEPLPPPDQQDLPLN